MRTLLWAELQPLAERFAAAGHRLYLVGGTVRDLLAGEDQPVFDLDATTTARPTEIKRLLQGWADAVWTQGERFGTIGALKQASHDQAPHDQATAGDGTTGRPVEPRVFEITTHRAEAYADDSRKPDVVFSDDVVADLSRRDFTVNAMAVEITTVTPELVDPFGGAADLRAGVLRTPLTATASFSDDPLRMLRAARFITRYQLEPVPDLVDAVRTMGARLEIVSAERIRDELDKLLVTRSPAAGLQFLVDTGLVTHAVPQLASLHGRSRPGSNAADALGYTLAVVAIAGPSPTGWSGDEPRPRLVRWAALFVELDADQTRQVMRDLRASGDDVAVVSSLVGVHHAWFDRADRADRADQADRALAAPDWSDADVRRFVCAAGRHLAESVALAHAAARASEPEQQARCRVDALVAAFARLSELEDLGAMQPALDGAAVMDALGLAPGRDVGRALAHLDELRLDQGPMNADESIRRLRQWWADHQE